MKKQIMVIGSILFLSGTLYAQQDLKTNTPIKSIVGIDTPTAYTIEKSSYAVSFLCYDNGGMELKTLVGLHDNLFIGASFDVQNVIGKDKIRPNIPGVIARLKFTDGWETFPISVAVGYDSFYIGTEGTMENRDNELDRMIYGPYLAITKPIYLFNEEQYISYGVRLPTQPQYLPNETSYFISLDIPLGPLFRLKGEMERVYWDLRDSANWLYNVGIRYTYLDQLGIEFDVLFQKNERPNRIVRIEYYGKF